MIYFVCEVFGSIGSVALRILTHHRIELEVVNKPLSREQLGAEAETPKNFKGRPTNRPTDQPTDTAYYRDARTHLKNVSEVEYARTTKLCVPR